MTFDERNTFDICGICFWEDHGIDDFEENQDSEPNHMTLKEGRIIFQEAKSKLTSAKFGDDKLIDALKDKFIKLDYLIEQNKFDKAEIIGQQDERLDLLTKNEVFGL